MKCMYKVGPTECINPSTFTCNDCQIQVLYCQAHCGSHFTETFHKNIEKLDLKHFKKQIETSISNIVTYSSDAITKISRTSQDIIIHLKRVINNVKNIDETTLKLLDAERISFLIRQVRYIDKKMSEILLETSEIPNIRKEKLADQITNILTSKGTN